ncbi:MAG: hypothetical protein F6J98_12735 [Moorea sp. SIO4G2]|nr:hypothetical protein [Moorena sp. SIO4G2]
MEWASVERASVERASWWNGHLARYNSQAGCPNALGWCVTGRAVSTVATRLHMMATPPLTHYELKSFV